MVENDSARHALLNVAKKLFAAKGFHATTVREIADNAKVNLGLVSYYFQGKEGLYKACIEQFGSAKLENVTQILQEPHTLEDMKKCLAAYIEDMFIGFIKEPDLVKLILQECDSEVPLIADIFDRNLKHIFVALVDFFSIAQRKKIISEYVDCMQVSIAFMGGIVHQIRMEPINKKYFDATLTHEGWRSKYGKQLVETTLNGIVTRG